MSRLLIANWKMNIHGAHARRLAQEFHDAFAGQAAEVALGLCPAAVDLEPLSRMGLQPRIQLGAQDCSKHAEGAFTGEIAAPMLAEAGAQLCLVGHSECRQYHQDTDASCRAKIEQCFGAGLTPVLCVGETLEELRQGHRQSVLERQVRAGLPAQPPAAGLERLLIAYEPVWAIGTGHVPAPDDIESVHAFLRGLLAEGDYKHIPTQILYGGSLSPAHSAQIANLPSVDGGLVGRDSLNLERFAAIVRDFAQKKHRPHGASV